VNLLASDTDDDNDQPDKTFQTQMPSPDPDQSLEIQTYLETLKLKPDSFSESLMRPIYLK